MAKATGGYEPGSSLTWHTGSGKYNYTSHGNIEALLIVPSLSSLSSEVVPRRPREELCKDEHRKLEHQGVPRECHYDDLSIMRTRFGLDETISISEVVTGESLTCEQVTEKITRLMNKTRAAIGKNCFSSTVDIQVNQSSIQCTSTTLVLVGREQEIGVLVMDSSASAK